MPRLYDADGNRYTIVYLDERFYPALNVVYGPKQWEDHPLLSAHTGQPLSFAHLPHATPCLVLHSRRSHRLGKRGIDTDVTVAPYSFHAMYHARKTRLPPDLPSTPVLASV